MSGLKDKNTGTTDEVVLHLGTLEDDFSDVESETKTDGGVDAYKPDTTPLLENLLLEMTDLDFPLDDVDNALDAFNLDDFGDFDDYGGAGAGAGAGLQRPKPLVKRVLAQRAAAKTASTIISIMQESSNLDDSVCADFSDDETVRPPRLKKARTNKTSMPSAVRAGSAAATLTTDTPSFDNNTLHLFRQEICQSIINITQRYSIKNQYNGFRLRITKNKKVLISIQFPDVSTAAYANHLIQKVYPYENTNMGRMTDITKYSNSKDLLSALTKSHSTRHPESAFRLTLARQICGGLAAKTRHLITKTPGLLQLILPHEKDKALRAAILEESTQYKISGQKKKKVKAIALTTNNKRSSQLKRHDNTLFTSEICHYRNSLCALVSRAKQKIIAKNKIPHSLYFIKNYRITIKATKATQHIRLLTKSFSSTAYQAYLVQQKYSNSKIPRQMFNDYNAYHKDKETFLSAIFHETPRLLTIEEYILSITQQMCKAIVDNKSDEMYQKIIRNPDLLDRIFPDSGDDLLREGIKMALKAYNKSSNKAEAETFAGAGAGNGAGAGAGAGAGSGADKPTIAPPPFPPHPIPMPLLTAHQPKVRALNPFSFTRQSALGKNPAVSPVVAKPRKRQRVTTPGTVVTPEVLDLGPLDDDLSDSESETDTTFVTPARTTLQRNSVKYNHYLTSTDDLHPEADDTDDSDYCGSP